MLKILNLSTSALALVLATTVFASAQAIPLNQEVYTDQQGNGQIVSVDQSGTPDRSARPGATMARRNLAHSSHADL